MDRTLATDHLRRTLKAVTEALQGTWKAAPGRDRREPGLEEKQQAEERLALIALRILRKQREQLIDRLAVEYPGRKALSALDALDLDDDDPYILDLIEQLIKMVKGGIALFGKRVKPAIDYTLTNAEAAKKAAEYAYELVKGINDTSKAALQDVITRFVETPGMTIGDIERELVDTFGPVRAEMIAVTETTRAYATGNQMAGEALAKEFPGVKVVKVWFTNNDDIVCDICRPLNGEEVEINDVWKVEGEEYDNPPAHVNCRCWTETSTALAEQGEEETEAPVIVSERFRTEDPEDLDINAFEKYKTAADAEEMQVMSRDWSTSLTDSEGMAVYKYTGADFSTINQGLRENIPEYITREKDVIDNLDSALNKSQFPKDTTVYRYAREFPKLNIGDEFTDNGFVSTSLRRESAASAAISARDEPIKILIPQNSHAAYVVNWSSHPGEEEVLIPRGSTFRVVETIGGYVLELAK